MSNNICIICNEKNPEITFECNHFIHKKCIDEKFDIDNCPLCFPQNNNLYLLVKYILGMLIDLF